MTLRTLTTQAQLEERATSMVMRHWPTTVLIGHERSGAERKVTVPPLKPHKAKAIALDVLGDLGNYDGLRALVNAAIVLRADRCDPESHTFVDHHEQAVFEALDKLGL